MRNFALATLLAFFSASAFAQSSVGTIHIEGEGRLENPYDIAQSEAIAYFETFFDALPQIAQGRVYDIPALSNGAAQHLAAVNLFCTLRFGSCPTLLQAMYEIEVARSVSRSAAECPNLNHMWKSWVDADMERRVDLDLRIGHVKTYDEFKTGERRKYIRCSASIGQLMESIDDKSAFFAARYAADGSAATDIRRTVAFLRSIQNEIPNIFGRLGLQR